MINRHLRNLIVGAVILAVAFPFALQLWRRTPSDVIDYTAFIELVQAGHVAQVEISDDRLNGRLKSGQHFTTFVPPNDITYIDLLKSKGVVIRVEPSSRGSPWPSLLSTLLPIILLLGLWLLMLRQAQSGSNFGSWLWKELARKRTIIAVPTLSPPRGFSHGILVKGGQLLFIAGQDASDTQGKIVAPGDLVRQFEQVLRNLNAVVQAAGGTLQDVVKLNVFVRDRRMYLANLRPIGEVFRRHFNGHYPTMALFEVSGFFNDDALIEVEGIAVLEAPGAGAPTASTSP